jgi:hypothetical protein
MLKISKNSALTDIVSTDGTNPIVTQHPIAGSSQVVQLWLFNNDNTKYYTGITIDPTDSNSADGDQSTWIQLSLDNVTYQSASAPLTFSDIGAAGAPDVTGHTFYAKITTPTVATTQNKTDIKLTVNFTEFAI